MQAASVESICNQLARSKLLAGDDIRGLRKRWLEEAGAGSADVNKFAKWLVARQYVTEYQINQVLRGKIERCFLGEYKLLDRIGQGRMAGVYQATHRLGQVVAIKVLPPSKAKDPQLLARFQRESRLAIRLRHPNVVRTFHSGEADGLHYIVMEYLEGDTLEEAVKRRGKLPPPEAARLVHQALLGLQHLQEEGVIHRDLKPANLMLVPAITSGQPDTTLQATLKILDIGLGRALFDEHEAKPAMYAELTATGDMVGVPDYMAPEQARDARTVDIRADIYSLGCVLYYTLAGQPPFPDANPVRQMLRHATESPQPFAALKVKVPDALEQIVMRMLAKDPAQRYPTPERAAQALQPLFDSSKEPARRSPDAALPAYLQWVEKNNGANARQVPEPVATPPALPRQPSPAVPLPRPAPPIPVAAPAAAAAPPTPAITAPAAVGVELVAVPAAKPASRVPFLRPTMRDWIMLGIGAGCVVFLDVIALLIWWLLSR